MVSNFVQPSGAGVERPVSCPSLAAVLAGRRWAFCASHSSASFAQYSMAGSIMQKPSSGLSYFASSWSYGMLSTSA